MVTLGWHREGIDVERQLPALFTYLGHTCVRHTYWYLTASVRRCCKKLRCASIDVGGQTMTTSCNVAPLIERYFTERLMHQRNVSANTIASKRDSFRLLFTFVS